MGNERIVFGPTTSLAHNQSRDGFALGIGSMDYRLHQRLFRLSALAAYLSPSIAIQDFSLLRVLQQPTPEAPLVPSGVERSPRSASFAEVQHPIFLFGYGRH